MTRGYEVYDASVKTHKAHSVLLRLAFPPYTIHFQSPTYMRDATLDMLDKKVCKETLRSTAQTHQVRTAIGRDPYFWIEIVNLFQVAVPSLERRSFTIFQPESVDYESTSGALIASNYPGLWKDLERLNDLVSIARNVLTTGRVAQGLAAEFKFEYEIFRLINCCVRVTARGYDGDAGTGEEEKWQWIVNAFKKLLITSLQFLNNFVAQNERRKLMLWVALFDHNSETILAPEDVPETSRTSLADVPSNPPVKPRPPVEPEDLLIAYGNYNGEVLDLIDALPLWKEDPFEMWPIPQYIQDAARDRKLDGNGYVFYGKRVRTRQIEDFKGVHGREPTLAEMHLELPRRWAELRERDHNYWEGLYGDAIAKYNQDLAVYEAKCLVGQAQPSRWANPRNVNVPVMSEEERKLMESKMTILEEDIAQRLHDATTVVPMEAPKYDRAGELLFSVKNEDLLNRPVLADDMKMLFTADAGARILESGKVELLKRLEGYAPPDPGLPPSRDPDGITTRPVKRDPGNNPLERTRSMSRSPTFGLHPNGPRNKGELDEWWRMNEGRPRQNMRQLPLQSQATSHPSLPAPAIHTEELMDEDELVGDDEEIEEEEESEGEEEEDDDDEDYPGSNEDGRGLLTDVPLILGPSEIEVLPMLIMSGIVPPPVGHPSNDDDDDDDEKNMLANMHTVRTHLLLSQSNGRNLLRELLIFVAAWDLREEELYFKFMVKIMEAILKNGLMPYAYHAFRDRSRSKDIISPAQAVIMKLLTCIFRGRGEAAKTAAGGKALDTAKGKQLAAQPPIPTEGDHDEWGEPSVKRMEALAAHVTSRVDLHILNFIFTEFRQHIIPQTCALIFLQGQIHAGRASPEDFPLNLWDMERMYEGVYQYLEFFAVLTEEGAWKSILGEWEMASELVTLLRELEGGTEYNKGIVQLRYGKGGPIGARRVSHQPVSLQLQHQQLPVRSLSADAAMPTGHVVAGAQQQLPQPPQQLPPTPAPVAVERPFDIESPADTTLPALPPHPTTNPIFEAETPLAYPEDPVVAPLLGHHGEPLHPPPHTTADQDEPSDFEWRNLKKLTVLVLSSLIWKNKQVQDQVRRYGGLEALVGCCRPDEHNPYIREHAIMCLRFAVEGNDENSKVIREMAARKQASGAGRTRMLEGGSVTLGVATIPPVEQDVPREVLDTGGYETFMDPKGQVGLRRKDTTHPSAPTTAGPSTHPPSASGITKQPPPPRLSASKMTAEKAAELMQNALRDLPLGDKLVTDKQKAEALAKLDRAFESTEKALGRKGGQGKAQQGEGRPAGA